ncbi:MAG: hypothetical protein JNL82_15555 [Myxococcales bacterium]|nr:hypothetical protein [Myxococcales bacterium]
MPRPRRLTPLAPLLLAGCPSSAEIAGGVLVLAPLDYLLALAVVYALYAAWKPIRPGLVFGGGIHGGAVLACLTLAVIGSQHAEVNPAFLWLCATGILGIWLILARLTLRTGWGFRWGGMVATAIVVLPSLLAIDMRGADAESMMALGLVPALLFGFLGVVPALVLLFALIEAAHARSKHLESFAAPPDPPA